MRADREGCGNFTHIRFFLDNYIREAGPLRNPSSLSRMPVATGFPSLDELLHGGLQRSDLIVLTSRPSFGKSALALSVVRNAVEHGFSAALSSLEMSGEQIAARLLASEADLDSQRLRLNLIREDEEVRVLDAVGLLSDLQIYVDEAPFESVKELHRKSRQLQQESGLDLLIVDYLQLMDLGDYDSRAVALGEVLRSLKMIARELDIPILTCSQLSPTFKHGPNHRPLLSDLQESGPIDKCADIVAYIHREDQYISREEWEIRFPADPYPENIAEIIVFKHRNEPVGTVPLYFRSDRARFETMFEVSEALTR